MKKAIAIDFDGVIHKYSKGWQDGEIYDEPVDFAFDAIQTLMQTNTVFVFTTRDALQVHEWIRKHIITEDGFWIHGYSCGVIVNGTKFWNTENVLGITNIKLPADVYIDDRALRFEGIWDDTLRKVKSFKTYQQYEQKGKEFIEKLNLTPGSNFGMMIPREQYMIPHSTMVNHIERTIITSYERMGYQEDSGYTQSALDDFRNNEFYKK